MAAAAWLKGEQMPLRETIARGRIQWMQQFAANLRLAESDSERVPDLPQSKPVVEQQPYHTNGAPSNAGLNGALLHTVLDNARSDAGKSGALSHAVLDDAGLDAGLDAGIIGALSNAVLNNARPDAGNDARPDAGASGALSHAMLDDAHVNARLDAGLDAGIIGAPSHAVLNNAPLNAGNDARSDASISCAASNTVSDDAHSDTHSDAGIHDARSDDDRGVRSSVPSPRVDLGTSRAGLSSNNDQIDLMPPLESRRKRRLADLGDNTSLDARVVGGYRLRGAKKTTYVPPTYVDPEPPINGDPFDGAMTFRSRGRRDDGEDRAFVAKRRSDATARSDCPDTIENSDALDDPISETLDDPASDPASQTIDSDAEFECPANAYIERECPAIFTSVDEARKHCSTFHSALPLGDPACDCAIKMKA